jgi:histidinol-phosphatase (PHP family)
MGLEMDFRREYGAAFGEGLAGKNVDFVLGSVHSAAGRRIYRLGDAGKADINLADLQAAYFDEVEALVATGLCHAIGHFDYVYKQLPALAALRRDAGYWRRVERILAMCIERGTAVEINTRRTEDGSRGMAVDLEILRRYHALGGRRVTVGADAHRPTEVAHGFAEAEGTRAATRRPARSSRRRSTPCLPSVRASSRSCGYRASGPGSARPTRRRPAGMG